jgi:hypothetical protein
LRQKTVGLLLICKRIGIEFFRLHSSRKISVTSFQRTLESL